MSDTNYQLPIPIGTPICVIEPCYCHEHYKTWNCQMHNGKKRKNATAIRTIPLPDKKKGSYRTRCLKLYIRPFDPVKHLSKFGKTAFATESEAITAAETYK